MSRERNRNSKNKRPRAKTAKPTRVKLDMDDHEVVFVDEEAGDKYRCGICLDVLDKSVSICEKHLFCEKCVDRELAVRSEENPNLRMIQCPICRVYVSILWLKPVEFIDREIINNLQCRCPNFEITPHKLMYLEQVEEEREKGSTEADHNHNHNHGHGGDDKHRVRSRSRSRSRSSLDARKKKKADKNKTIRVDPGDDDVCRDAVDVDVADAEDDEFQKEHGGAEEGDTEDGDTHSKLCDWVGSYKDWHSHIGSCPLHVVQCGKCLQLVLRKDMDAHPFVCQSKIVECPYCRRALKRSKVKSHYETCPEMQEACSFADYGCPAVHKRCDRQKHHEENMFVHLELVKYSHRDLQHQVNRLEKSVKKLNTRQRQNFESVLKRVEKLEIVSMDED